MLFKSFFGIVLFILFACPFCKGQHDSGETILVHTDRSVYLSGETILFNLYCNENNLSEMGTNSKLAYAELINDQKEPVAQCIIPLNNGKGEGYLITPPVLPTGIYEYRAYTKWMRNWGEQNFYRQSVFILNPNDSVFFESNKKRLLNKGNSITVNQLSYRKNFIDISFDKEMYRTRSIVNVKILLPAVSDISILSVAVLPASEAEIATLDLGEKRDSTGINQIKYIPELEGPVFKIKVADLKSEQPLSGVMTLLSSPGRLYIINPAKTNSIGESWFNPGLHLKRGDLIAQVLSPQNSHGQLKLEIDPIFAPVKDVLLIDTPILNENQLELLRQRYVQLQLEEFFSPIPTITDHSFVSRWDSLPIGKPDKRYKLVDYFRFSTMQEIFREFITEIRARKVDSLFQIRVRNKQLPGFFEGEPLLLIDGLIVHNANDLMAMNPADIAEIEVFMQKLVIGEMINDGVIQIKTVEGNYRAGSLPSHAITIAYPGIQPSRKIKWPEYAASDKKNGDIPDRRQLLYWNTNPQVADRELNLQFFTSDLKGLFKIKIRGVNSRLSHIEETASFEVF